MIEKNFVNKYLEDLSVLVKPNEEILNKIIKVKNILVSNHKKKRNEPRKY